MIVETGIKPFMIMILEWVRNVVSCFHKVGNELLFQLVHQRNNDEKDMIWRDFKKIPS